jgi:hypothetical protein
VQPSPDAPEATTAAADEPNLRVVRELDTGNDNPEMHLTALVVEEA